MKIWSCKIGELTEEELHDAHPNPADPPMRAAIERAYRDVTGRDPQFIFSGWGAELEEIERAVVENREPV